MDRVLAAVEPVSVTVAGAKEQVAPLGSPEQLRVMGPLKPAKDVSVIPSVPVDPRATLRVEVFAVT
jgi:hypothetical protein